MVLVLLMGLFPLVCCAVVEAVQFAETDTQSDRFKLYTQCKPVYVDVTYNPEQYAHAPYPAKDTVLAAIRSRLRAARIFTGTYQMSPQLIIVIEPLGLGPNETWAAHIAKIHYSLFKMVIDPATEMISGAATWGLIIHTGAQRVHEKIAEGTDVFIDEYLRVNESACRAK